MWCHHDNFTRSRILGCSIILASAMTLAMLLFTAMPLSVRLFAILFLILYTSVLLHHLIYYKGCASIQTMTRVSKGVWVLGTTTGSVIGTLRGDAILSQWGMVLRFDIANRLLPLSHVVMRDSLARDDFRRLLLTLRLDH